MKARLLAATFAAVLLAGCGSGHKHKADQRTASGQVLPGTISDAMLPLATVTSQPPRLKVESPATSSSDAEDQDAQDDAGAAALDETTDDAPPIATGSAEGD